MNQCMFFKKKLDCTGCNDGNMSCVGGKEKNNRDTAIMDDACTVLLDW